MSKIYTQTEKAEGNLNDHAAVTGTDVVQDDGSIKRAQDVNSIKTLISGDTFKINNQITSRTSDMRTGFLLQEILYKLDLIEKNLRILNDIDYEDKI